MVSPENTNWLYDYGFEDIPVSDGSFSAPNSGFSWPSHALNGSSDVGMGRSCWRRMTSYQGSRKRKLCQHKVGEDFRMFKAGNKNGLGLTEDDMTRNIATNDAWGVKRQKADGLVVTEEEQKEESLEASKNIVAIGDENWKTSITEPEDHKLKNASDARDVFTEISSSNFETMEGGSVLSGIPLPSTNQGPRPGVIFVFEKASLVLAKINKTYQIINPDEHAGFMQKHNLNRRDYRPDIIHEVLKRLLGSRINLAGGIQAVYVKTIQGHLIKIEPTLCVPRTLKGFCCMMSQLFQNLSIKGSRRTKCRKLLQMIKNPVTIHLPVGSHKIGLSSTSPKTVNLWEYFATIGNDHPLVFVIGAMAHGKIGSEYTDDFIAVSGLPLSASLCVRRICNALERQRRIL